MSSERPSKTNRIRKIAGSLKGKPTSLIHLPRAPTQSSMEMGSSSDNPTSISFLDIEPEPEVGIDHAPTTAPVFATEAYTLSRDRPISAPVLGSLPVAKQLGSASGRGSETQPTHMSLHTRSLLSPSLPDSDAIMQVFKDSEQVQDSGSGLFANAQNVPTGGTLVVNNILPNNELFVGRKDVLDKLRNIFNGKSTSRRSCLLWGTGGIGKTHICLKFIEEMSGSLSHVFWIDASSVESITMSFGGISATQPSYLDDSVESILQWMSGIQEEWLIVFDNADNPPVYVVEKFIPPGNRGNTVPFRSIRQAP